MPLGRRRPPGGKVCEPMASHEKVEPKGHSAHVTAWFNPPPTPSRRERDGYWVVAPAAIHAAMTARSWSVICVTLPSGMMRVATVC